MKYNLKFDETKYTLENIKNAFPNHDIETNADGIYVKNKNNTDSYDYVFRLIYKSDGSREVWLNCGGENDIKLNYNKSGQLLTIDDGKVLTSYNEAGKKKEETDKMTGITTYFDDKGKVYAREGKLLDESGDISFYRAEYKNGRMTSITNIFTGIRIEYDNNGLEKEKKYDGDVVAGY